MSLETPVTPAALKAALRHGSTNGQSAKALAQALSTTERAIRQLVDDLIADGVPVCAHPTTGYYIPRTRGEVDQSADFLKDRGLHSLKKAKDLRDAFFNWELAHPELVANPTPDYQPGA